MSILVSQNNYFYKRYIALLFSVMVILLPMPSAKADIIFDFYGNHALYGKAKAELRLKDSYKFGSQITANTLKKLTFTSSKHKFTIYPKEVLSIYAALGLNGKITNSAGNYQFYIDAKNNKFFGARKDGTWRARSDINEGNLGRWVLRTKGFKQVCLDHDNFHKAAARGELAYVNQCLKSGVAVNSKEGNGWTALHSAASKGQISVVRSLLKHGAKQTIKDKFGRTARDYAVRAKQYNTVAVLDSGR